MGVASDCRHSARQSFYKRALASLDKAVVLQLLAQCAL